MTRILPTDDTAAPDDCHKDDYNGDHNDGHDDGRNDCHGWDRLDCVRQDHSPSWRSVHADSRVERMGSINTFLRALERKPVIAGIKQLKDARAALRAQIEIIFFLTGTIFELKELLDVVTRQSRERRALVFSHVDLLQGIGRDPAGMRFLAREIGVDGILTTRSHLIRAAKDEGLYTIQRLFLLDSEAIKTAVNVLTNSKPDAVEILPALVLPNIWRRLPLDKLPPIIAGGLVETENELRTVLSAPVKAVSTSRQALWAYNV